MHNDSPRQISKTRALITCPTCKSDDIITDADSGEVICRECGRVVVERMTANGPEWRAFSIDEANSRSRAGTPSSLARHDMGLTTVIGRTARDAGGQLLNPEMRSKMYRLRMWDYRAQMRNSTSKNLQHAFSQLARIKDALALSDPAVERAAYIYRKAQDGGLVRGRTVDSIMAASVCIACREMGVLRTLNDVAGAAGLKTKEVAKCYRIVVFSMGLTVPNIDAIRCVVKVANNVNVKEKEKRRAIDFLRMAEGLGISDGKDPMGLAATAIYLACLESGEDICQTTIAEAAGVTEVTIRNRSSELRKMLSIRKPHSLRRYHSHNSRTHTLESSYKKN